MRKTNECILIYRFQVVGCEEAAWRNLKLIFLLFRVSEWIIKYILPNRKPLLLTVNHILLRHRSVLSEDSCRPACLFLDTQCLCQYSTQWGNEFPHQKKELPVNYWIHIIIHRDILMQGLEESLAERFKITMPWKGMQENHVFSKWFFGFKASPT